eukprot:s465_g8.t1
MLADRKVNGFGFVQVDRRMFNVQVGPKPDARMSVARLLLCWSMVRGEWSRLTDLADAGLVRPAARSEHVAAWDEVNQVLLIHGGSNLEGDLWAFDAASEAWTRTVTAVAPAARAAHAAGWDPANHALWVHGGYNSQTLAWFRDGWRLQSGAWTLELHDAGPSSREAHIAVWDESTAALWVHGGWTGTRHLSDLWRYNSNAHGWQELLLSGTPSGRSSHVAVWDSTRHAMWLHGGYGDALLADLWTLHAATLSWTEVPFSGGPSPRPIGALVSRGCLGRPQPNTLHPWRIQWKPLWRPLVVLGHHDLDDADSELDIQFQQPDLHFKQHLVDEQQFQQ